MKPAELIFLGLCVAAALRPLLWSSADGATSSAAADRFPGWAEAPIPAGLRPLELAESDRRFVGGFPGRIGVFTDGESRWVVRWLARPSRKLHPVGDCLRATGYAVTPRPIRAAADGSHWGVSAARRGTERLLARERIVDAAGREFTDVSAWFWAAALDRSLGPWWSVTEIRPEGRTLP